MASPVCGEASSIGTRQAKTAPCPFPLRALLLRLPGPRRALVPWERYLPSDWHRSPPCALEEAPDHLGPEQPAAPSSCTGGYSCSASSSSQHPAGGGVAGRVWILSRTAQGSRQVQHALERASTDSEREALAGELRNRIWEASHCPHANHVVQKVVVMLRPQAAHFVVRELEAGGYAAAVQHKYACRIVQRLMEYGLRPQVHGIAEALLAEAGALMRHPFGNYVMQHVLEHGSPEQQARLRAAIKEDLAALAGDGHGVAVVTAAVATGEPSARRDVAGALARAPPLLAAMACTRSGHIAVAAVLGALPPEEREAVLATLAEQREPLRASRYGRVVIAKCLAA